MPNEAEKFKLVIIAPTCFYYQVDLFRELASHPRIDLKVYFCSAEALHGQDVLRQFKANEQWGVEETLLQGYDHKFLRNYSPRPSYLKWPFGLMNFGVWRALERDRPHAVVLMSWMNPTWWLAILACLRFKMPFFYMTDTNVQAEPLKPKLVSWIKRVMLGKVLFPLASGFLYAGEANKQLYAYYGVEDEKLIPFAFSWGYKEFLASSDQFRSKRKKIRAELGIPEDNLVALYCGRFSQEKTPQVLLEAYKQVYTSSSSLLLVGDGELRPSMEKYKADNNLDSVHFFGFQNRQEISKFYAVSDFLVLPSLREATGGVINEAMCFGLPVIISDQVGFGKDFVTHGYNGYSFPVGDVGALANNIQELMDLPQQERDLMGERSTQVMEKWLGRDLPNIIVQYLEYIIAKKAPI